MPLTNDISLITTDWASHRQPLESIRTRVFIEEQNIPPQMEWDEHETDSWHVLAKTSQQQFIGCGRLQPDGKLTRIAVLKQWRGRGVANAIVAQLIMLATQHNLPRLYLNAQTTAISLYEKHGFITSGEAFDEAGIPHIKMQRL